MIIATWILVATINGGAPSTPAHTIMISDMPDQAECQRVGLELNKRWNMNKALCLEVKKVKP